jgi:hypothetical protein
MTRFSELSHGLLVSLVLILPLLRLGWDQWAQTAVALMWSFLAGLGSLLVLLGRSGEFSRFELFFRRWGLLLVAALGASVVSALLSPYPRSAFPAVPNDFVAFAFVLLGAGISAVWRSRYVAALAGAGILAVLSVSLVGGGFAAGPLLNPNLLAALVILTAPVALEFCWGPKHRILWRIGFGVLIWGVFVSQSMAAYGAALMQVLLAMGFLWMRKENKKKTFFLFLCGMGCFVVVGFFLTRAEWPKLFQGDSDRWTWGLTAVRTFAAHPILGVGPGAFGEAYPVYRASPWGLNSLFAHNFALEFFAERGIVGAGALFIFCGSLFLRAWKSVVRGGGTGLFLGLVGFCFFNLFHIGFSFPALYWLFFFTAGLAGREEQMVRESGQMPNEGLFSSVSSGRRDYPHRKVVAIIALSLAVLVGLASFALFRSDQSIARARVSLLEERWEIAKERVETGLFWNPWNSGLYELRAAVRLKTQDWDGAKTDLDRAVALAPSSAGLRAESAELAIERGDVDHALREYETAVRLLPLKAAFWERWGDLLLGRGRSDDANRAYDGALRALSDPRVLGGNAERRAEWTKRVAEKKQGLANASKN